MPAKKRNGSVQKEKRSLLVDALQKRTAASNMRAGGGGVGTLRAGGGGVSVLRAGGVVGISRGAIQDDVARPRTNQFVGMGWVPDIPSRLDYDWKTSKVREALENGPRKIKALKSDGEEPTGHWYDNIAYCPPVENQGELGSCTAHSVVGMMEYMMLRAKIPHVNLSRLFLYKVTRRLMNWTGDTGAYLRTTLQAAANFGVPPEHYWPYDFLRFEEDPEAFHYCFASNFQALNYTRIDSEGTGPQIRKRLKRFLEAGLVAVFGFPVYDSISYDGDVPFPKKGDSLEGGHAVLAVGFDDDYMVAGEESGTGAVVFQNSWDIDWGVGGYGYIPYRYFDEALAVDIWTVLKQEWIDQSKFDEP